MRPQADESRANRPSVVRGTATASEEGTEGAMQHMQPLETNGAGGSRDETNCREYWYVQCRLDAS